MSGEKPWRLADSAFRSESSPNITHATDATGDRTLCGRDCTEWVQEDPHAHGPDCRVCYRAWSKRRAKPSSQQCTRCHFGLSSVGTLIEIDPSEHPGVWLCPACEVGLEAGEWSLEPSK